MKLRRTFISVSLLFFICKATPVFANQKESYRELISKSQNLSLQHDRLQACQVLIRAIQKEPRTSMSYRELKNTLESLSGMFYTDQAQATYAQGESLLDAKPKEAIEKYQEALKLEEGNMTLLKALARAQLRIDDCRAADRTLQLAESFDSISAEYYLLKLQALKCHKDDVAIVDALETGDSNLEGVEKYLKVFNLEQSFSKKDYKKAKQQLSSWEQVMPDYPEIYFWRWQISLAQLTPEKAMGQKYVQLCKALSPRKRKSYNLDVDLCKSVEDVESKLKNLKPDPI